VPALIVPLMIAAGTLAIPAQAQDARAPAAENAAKAQKQTPDAALPKDIYPDSRFRLPLVKRETLDEQGKKLYDRSAGPTTERNLVGLQGPTGIRLYNPALGTLSRAYNDYLRFDAGLKGNVRELTILISAREMDSQFEWAAHEPVARKEGLEPATIDAIKYRRSVRGLPEPEAALIELGREEFHRHKVSSATFARALKAYGPKDLVSIVSLMGYYGETGMLLEVFDLRLPPGQKPLLPMP